MVASSPFIHEESNTLSCSDSRGMALLMLLPGLSLLILLTSIGIIEFICSVAIYSQCLWLSRDPSIPFVYFVIWIHPGLFQVQRRRWYFWVYTTTTPPESHFLGSPTASHPSSLVHFKAQLVLPPILHQSTLWPFLVKSLASCSVWPTNEWDGLDRSKVVIKGTSWLWILGADSAWLAVVL